ncbi:penicillin-binding protein, 1A family [Desulfofundulus kuznetsovii DSM 6115]|uniref:Penicillin-binding protein 1A n=1 Tax=Desulfofundulus kuznetsovii (strain DSM 6115 / VKM B-1805 / 17) TaxID=760568 RepID=A0AAU8P8W2_DESK7|nr:penicillin-binding protein, 1A family [Desulfofundulus kuznetsovii DSM 6115]
MARRKKRRLNIFRLIISLFLLLMIAGGVAALGLVVVSIKDLPAWSEEKLLSSASTSLYDQNKELITRVGEENRVPVDLKDIPKHVQEAFLAIEDVRFYQHRGVDLRGIARAAWTDITGGRIQEGGSTITQQLVKLSFLSHERTFKRKIQQVILAVMVERRYTKDEILEMYLNKVYFGEGAYGIQSAAETYFNKPARELTLSEGALLAGLVQAPSAYSPFRNPEGATRRRNLVLNNMARYGFITAEQAAQARAIQLDEMLKPGKGRQYPYPYFVDYVTEQLVNKYGTEQVFKGGLRVYTTLDPVIQEAAEKALSDPRNFPASARDNQGILQPEGAAVVLDPHTGYIKAIVGGREHTHRLQWNRATMAPGRQPGSTFKPIIAYGPAIEYKGMAPASVIDDIPVKYGNYTPRNYDGRYRGLVTMRTAIAKSINVVAVRVLMDHVGIANALKFARGLGINLNPSTHGPSMALGGLHEGVTPLQMAAAYGAFANQGIYLEPTAITRVEDASGHVIYEYQPKPVQAMRATTAYLITDMLKTVIESGTGTNARIGRPAAGKTGTSDQGKDLWFAGYTPELVGVVWIGYDKPRAMPHEFGGRYPALIWRQIMTQALKNTPVRDFPRPGGIVSATVDSKSGLLPGPNTPPSDVVTDLFAQGTVPTRVDDTHVLVEVCATTGQLPNQYCPDRITKVMIKLPYNVPSFVEDYAQRVPTTVCTLHTAEEPAPPPESPGQPDQPGQPGQPGEVIPAPPGQPNPPGQSDTGLNQLPEPQGQKGNGQGPVRVLREEINPGLDWFRNKKWAE